MLIAEDGGFFDEYETRPIAYRIRGKTWVNNHAHVLRAKNGTSNAWVFWNLVHKDIRHYIKGGTRSKLNQAELREIEIPMPEPAEQALIADILDTLDDAIHQTQQLIDKLKNVRAGLLHDLLTYGIDENGDLRDPVRHPEQFKESELGLIPRDWDVCEIDEVASITYGINQAIDQMLDTGVPTITLPCVRLDSSLVISDELLAWTPTRNVPDDRILRDGDILFNWRNGSANHLGKTAYFKHGGVDFTHVGFLLRVRTVSERYKSKFLWWQMRKMHLDGFYLRAKIQVNNTYNSGELGATRVKFPLEVEQDAITEVLDTVEAQIFSETQVLQVFTKLKKGLANDLLTGKVRVVDLLEDNDSGER